MRGKCFYYIVFKSLLSQRGCGDGDDDANDISKYGK